MSPPSGPCEITESTDDDLDLKALTLAKIKIKPEEAAAAAIDNKSPNARNHHHSRPLAAGPSRLSAMDLAHKSVAAMKRPIRPPGTCYTPGPGGAGQPLDTASLKQALRRLSIVQASEMAAMKRMSKPAGVSTASEAGTIQRLYASVVVQAGGGTGGKEGKNNGYIHMFSATIAEEKRPPAVNNNKPGGGKVVECNTSNSKRTISPRVTKPRVRDIMASTSPRTEREPSPRARRAAGKQKPNKSGASPRLARPPLHNRTTTTTAATTPEKGSGIPTPSLSITPKDLAPNRFHQTDIKIVVPATPTKKQLPTQRKESGCCSAASNATAAAAGHGLQIKPTEQKSYPLPQPGSAPTSNSSTPDARAVMMKRVEFPRNNLEKGESSQSSKSSIGDYSSSCCTSISGDSNQSGYSVAGTRPHMSNDVRWASIRSVEVQNRGIGLMNFKLLKRLGCGDIGTVYLAELCGSGCLFALKVMDNEFLARRRKMMRALTEREILQMLDHPFLPTLYTYFTTDNLSCLVMEYCPGGDLHVLRQKQPGRHFSEPSARFYVAEVLLALEYLHMLGVVYRDLKPENILVREDGHIMLSDFDLSLRCSVNPFLARASSVNAADCARPSGACAGSGCIDPLCLHSSWAHSSCFTPRLMSSATPRTARKLKLDQAIHWRSLPQVVVEPTEARSNSFVGTHEYLAPEIIKGEGHGSSVDWWTFGIFLYELLFGKTPFKGSGNEETLANVTSQNLKFPDSPAVSFRARDLIRGLLVKEPENRLGSRRGAAEIKRHPFFEGLNWALIRCATPPEMPKPCDYGSIVAEILNKKEEKAMDLKEKGNNAEFEIF